MTVTTKNPAPKVPLAMRLIRAQYGITYALAPKRADRMAFNLFCTPIRFKYPEPELAYLERAEKMTFQSMDRTLHAYAWGNGPIVFLMHGWAGRATQFRKFIDPLVENGYRVVALDAPGHGKSEGKITNLYEFSQAILDLSPKIGPVEAAIGHSLGGSAIFIALNQGFEAKKRVIISTPTIGDDIIKTFLGKIGGKPSSGDHIRQVIHDRFGQPFDHFTATHQAPMAPEGPTILFHGTADREAHPMHAHALSKALPKAELHLIEGLGHSRILKNEEVISKTIDFLKREPKTSVADKKSTEPVTA